MKTQEELEALKNEFIQLNEKLAELTEEEMALIVAGDNVVNKSMPKIEEDEKYVM